MYIKLEPTNELKLAISHAKASKKRLSEAQIAFDNTPQTSFSYAIRQDDLAYAEGSYQRAMAHLGEIVLKTFIS